MPSYGYSTLNLPTEAQLKRACEIQRQISELSREMQDTANNFDFARLIGALNEMNRFTSRYEIQTVSAVVRVG